MVKGPLLNVGDARDVVRSLGWEDHLEEEMVTHASILDWRIPWTEEPGRLWPMRWQKFGHNWVTERRHTHRYTHTQTHTHTHTQSKERGGVWGFRAGNSSWGGSRGGEMLARQKCPMCRQAAQVKKLPLGTRPFSNLIYCLDFPYKREFLLCFQSFSCVCTFLKLASLKSLWV